MLASTITSLEQLKTVGGINLGRLPQQEFKLVSTAFSVSNILETLFERKSRLQKMVATAQIMLALTKGVVNVGVVSFLKPVLKSWQLCLSFKLDVHRHPQLKDTL